MVGREGVGVIGVFCLATTFRNPSGAKILRGCENVTICLELGNDWSNERSFTEGSLELVCCRVEELSVELDSEESDIW